MPSATACARRVASVSMAGQQEPAAGGLRRPGAGRHRRPAGPGAGAGARGRPARPVRGATAAGADQRPQRGQRVVADAARPGQLPQRRGHRPVVGGADGVGELAEEVRAAAGQGVDDREVHRRQVELLRVGQRQRSGVGEVQRHPAVGPGQRAVAGPEQLAGGGELVEHRGCVVDHPRRQHQRLQRAGGYGAAGELLDHGDHAVDAAQTRRRAVETTCCQAGRNRPSVAGSTGSTSWRSRASDRRRSRRSTSASHHSAPVPAGRNSPSSTRPDAASRTRVWWATATPSPSRVATSAVTNGPWVRANRATRSPSGSSTGSVNASGVPGGHRHAEPVAQPGDVLDDRPALDTGQPHLDHAARLGEQRQPVDDLVGCRAPRLDLLGRQRAEQPEQVDDPLGVARLAVVGQPLQLGLDLGEHLGVEQLAQLGPAEQLGEQPLVERQRGGAALGDRGVALVHEGRDVAEQQRPGERRRRLRGDVDELHLAPLHPLEQRGQCGHVVDVLEHLADRLEDDREGRVLGGDLEQLGAASDAAATAASAGPGRGAEAAAPAPRTRGSGRRTAPSRRPRWSRSARSRRARTRSGRRRAGPGRSRGSAARCRRRRPSPGRRCRSARAAGR